jgi:flagellar hook protein FlgE
MSLNSLFTGLSGIQVHQQRTNVVANNLANINTTGYKSQRANFEEQLSQTLKEATSPEGPVSGTNPIQAGTGVRLKSIETNFAQGSLQTTDKNTDLALEGDGFFILSAGNGARYYTRDGSFGFDADGRFVNTSNGMLVMGNLAEANGEFTGGATDLEPIYLDLQKELPGEATSEIKLSGNLDPGSIPVLISDTAFTVASTFGGAGVTGAIPETQIQIRLTSSAQPIEGQITIPAATYNALTDLSDALNGAIAANESLVGKVVAQVDEAGQLELRATGGSGVTLNVADVTVGGVAGIFGAGPGAGAASVAAATATEINTLSQVGKDLDAGDVIQFSGSRANGTTYEGTFTYGAANDGTTIGSLLTALGNEFGSGVTAALDANGKITVTDAGASPVTGFTSNFRLQDTGTTTSGLVGPVPPEQHRISTKIFDSQGAPKTLTVTLTESLEFNKWTYDVKIDGQRPQTGSLGTVTFNEDGSNRVFKPIEGVDTQIEFAPAGGVQTIRISLSGERQADPDITGLTQFSRASTAGVALQDGRMPGSLERLFVSPDGVIEGAFDNGETMNLARVIIANFENPNGLQRRGGNIYGETENSGTRNEELPTVTTGTQVVSGSLELSNVDMARELTDLIISQRGFQANSRVVTTTDQILAETVNLKQ